MFNNTNRNTRATLEQILNDQFLEIKAQIQACGSREEAEATLRKVFGNTDGLKVSYFLDMLFGKRSGEAQAPEEETVENPNVNLVSSLMNAIPEGSEESYFKLTVEIGGKGATLIGKFLEDQVRKNAEIFAEADENVAIGIKTKFERRVG